MSVARWRRWLRRVSAPEPERPKPHAPGCEGCSYLVRIDGRYKPSAFLLAKGAPLSCVSICTGATEDMLRELAADVGLVRVQP